MPLYRIVFPGNVSAFFEMTLLLALFDFLENFAPWDDTEGLFDEEAEFEVLPQIENIGYESHNTIQNLNTVAVVMVLLSIRVLFALICRCFKRICCCGNECLQKTYNYLMDGVFMNLVNTLGIEIFMEVVVVVYLNFLPKDGTALQAGEVVGYYVSGLGILIAFVGLPVSVVWLIWTKPPREQLESEETKSVWGVLYDDLRTDRRWELAYYLIFIVRRALFLLLGLYILQDELAIFQVMGAMFLNLLASIYVGWYRPWRVRAYNRVELFNEALVAFAGYQLVYYTDFVPDPVLKADLGWMLIGTVSFLCLVSLILVLWDSLKLCWPRLKYSYIWCSSKCGKDDARLIQPKYAEDAPDATVSELAA